MDEEVNLEGKWVIVCESVGQGSHKGDRFVFRCNAFWGDGNTWNPQTHLNKPQLFDTRNDAIERTKLITLGSEYQLGVIQAVRAEAWVTAKVNAAATYTQEQLDEAKRQATEFGRRQGADERDEWFAEQVLDYHAGCEEGKREFLAEIGFTQYAEKEWDITASVTFTATEEAAEEMAEEVRRVINDYTSAYCSTVDVEEQ
jgi:hypothetical protein